MLGAPTIGEVFNQPVFNPNHVEWLEPDSYLHLGKYDTIPVSAFLEKAKKIGVDVQYYEGCTATSQVLFMQMDNPMTGYDKKFQKVLDFFEVQALN
jgi:hypothetical protein